MEIQRLAQHEISWDDEKVSRLWDYYSRTPPYKDVYFSKLFGLYILRAARLPLNQSLSVLDFGCGPGFIWDHLQAMKSRWNYSAIDFSPESIFALKAKASGSIFFGQAHHVTQLPTCLGDASFDVILLIEVVEHLQEEHLSSTLAEAFRLLKRGGMLVVTTPNQEDLSRSKKFCPECCAVFHEWQHVRSWSVTTLSSCLDKFGFVLEFYRALDFSEHGLGVRSCFLRLRRLIKLVCGISSTPPHLVGVFRKK